MSFKIIYTITLNLTIAVTFVFMSIFQLENIGKSIFHHYHTCKINYCNFLFININLLVFINHLTAALLNKLGLVKINFATCYVIEQQYLPSLLIFLSWILNFIFIISDDNKSRKQLLHYFSFFILHVIIISSSVNGNVEVFRYIAEKLPSFIIISLYCLFFFLIMEEVTLKEVCGIQIEA